jgi:transcription elongation factor GreA
MVDNSLIISEAVKSTDKLVQIGTTVTVQNITEKDDPETYTIVGSTEADPTASLISNESPIGSAILGKTKDDVVKVKVPAGLFEYKILKVK